MPSPAISALALLATILVATDLPADSSTVSPPPDIVVILADDMGFSDLGCYGGEIETPHLDQLAADGLRFTQFYNTGRCCPTRASLLTGLYPHQAGVGHMMDDKGYDGYRGNLNNRCVTIAEVLGDAGYGTYMAGKWHVTKEIAPDGPRHNWPLQRGFDRFYGTIHGAGSFYDPNTLCRDNTFISPYADPEYQTDQYFYTDAISAHACRYILEHDRDRPDDPLFLYVAYTSAHWPMHALDRDIAKYHGRYDGGYTPIRQSRWERTRQLGLIRDDWQLTPPAESWTKVQNPPWEIRNMEVYAAMVDSMDQGIGRIVTALRRAGRLERTLLFYLQDNGGCAEGMGRTVSNHPTGPRLASPTLPQLADDYLQPDMIPRQTRDGYPVRQGPDVFAGPADTYIGYGRGWANVSNTPFREFKHWVHEGGIATPLIAHWPEGIPRRGELAHEPAHLIDIMTTCVDVARATYPTARSGNPITPMEGRSLTPVFVGQPLQREALFWEHEGNRAVRQGKWKLVAKGANGPWELYDMDSDRTEMHDLAATYPDRVGHLALLWETYAERAHVLPLNPKRPTP